MFLNKPSLYILYCSLIVPYFSYCVEIWGHAYTTNIKPIFILQKKAIRIANHSPYNELTNSIFCKFKAIKLSDLVSLNTAVFMFKVNMKILPENILCLFEKREQKYNLRGENMFKKQMVRTNFKMNTISVKGVDLWNGLTDDFKRSNSIHYFKNQFKTSFFVKYMVA